MAELVKGEGLGVVVEPRDVQAVAAALRRLLEDDVFARACSEAALRVSERFRWSAAAAPLIEFCRNPRLSPDAGRRARRHRGSWQALVAKGVGALREDGLGSFAGRTYRYLRRRIT
jgi:hypothetical protein